MAIVEIKEWLQSGDYDSGVRLYTKYGSSSVLKKLFAAGPTVYNKEKIRKELSRLNDTLTPPEIRFKVGKSATEYDALPLPVKKLKEEKDLLFKQMAHLHSRLLDMTEQERGRAAFEILAIDSQLTAIWSRLDEYAKTGKLPEPEKAKAVPDLSPLEIQRRITNLRTYLSKGRVEYQQELDMLVQKLNQHGTLIPE